MSRTDWAHPEEARAAEDLVARYTATRHTTERLAEPLSPEDQTIQSMADCSPTKWHRAHTSWFFETFLLEQHGGGYRPFDERFRFLFNSYYEAVGPRWTRAERGLLSRPSADTVTRYRHHVDEGMDRLLGDVPQPDVLALVELGLHHEQQHQELLLMDAKHLLSRNPDDGAYRRADGAPVPSSTPIAGWVELDGGICDIGAVGHRFSFDNERPRHPVLLAPFALARAPVTNQAWCEFIEDGGYRRAELWLADGWAAAQAEEWAAPLYWLRDGDGWAQFTLRGTAPLDPTEAVCHVSFYEADAFARWSGARLPSEAEWEVAAAGEPVDGNLLESDRLHPGPSSGGRLGSLFGDVWEWTASPYVAYPGFRPAAGAVGEYNGKFMVNQQVLRGGSCATPQAHVRATYRNFFPPGARWAFSGLRLARDSDSEYVFSTVDVTIPG